MPNDAQEIFKQVRQDIDDRLSWESRQATCYRLRFGTQRRRIKPYKNASDFPWLLVDTDIDKIKPSYVEQFLGPELVASFFAKKPQCKGFTTAVARWFDYKLKKKSNFVKAYMHVIDAFLQGGKGFMEITWDPKKGQVDFQSVAPTFVIAPVWTGPLEDADRITRVIWLSKAQYQRVAEARGYNNDPDFIKKICGEGDSTDGRGSNDIAEAKKLREGIGWHTKKEMVILWQMIEREQDDTLTVHTMSPLCRSELVRPDFKFPYRHGKFNIVPFDYEITDPSFYSPRGVAEILGVYQQMLKVSLDTQFDYSNYCNRPIFKPTQGAAPINVQNLELIPGQLINADISPVEFPEPPLNFIEMQNQVRGIAEQRIGAPDTGLATQAQLAPSKQPKTAQEAKQIGLVSASRQNLGARIFSISHYEVLCQAWELLLQYDTADLNYFWRDEYAKLPPEAFQEDTDVYELLPTGSADGYSREQEINQLTQLRQLAFGQPWWNDPECGKRLIELINPDLVKYLYIDVPTGVQDQAKNQADEVATMSFGFEPMPSQEDNDLVHIQTIEQFKSHCINTGHVLPPDFLMVLIRHEDAHIIALRHKAPEQYKLNSQMLVTIQSQNATIAKMVLQATQQAMAQNQAEGAPPPPPPVAGNGNGQGPSPMDPNQPLQLAIPNPLAGVTNAKPPVPPGGGGLFNPGLPKGGSPPGGQIQRP